MSLDPRLIALQGVGGAPRFVALQGLVPVVAPRRPVTPWAEDDDEPAPRKRKRRRDTDNDVLLFLLR